ncbi:MAG: PD40 domain-containing protein [Spirochaetia bacterium]|nr:PD40 domain-containing protein [Spirochaetia bacterium]
MRKALPALLLILSAASLLSQAGGVVTYLTDGAATPKDEVKSATSSSARFSPDGTRVVFITHADNFTGPHKFFKITQVAELEIATGKVTYITDGDYYQSEPSYSPDGNRIVFRTESQNFGKVKNKFDKKGMRVQPGWRPRGVSDPRGRIQREVFAETK